MSKSIYKNLQYRLQYLNPTPIPPTAAFHGTPAAINAIWIPQVAAIELIRLSSEFLKQHELYIENSSLMEPIIFRAFPRLPISKFPLLPGLYGIFLLLLRRMEAIVVMS